LFIGNNTTGQNAFSFSKEIEKNRLTKHISIANQLTEDLKKKGKVVLYYNL
jgi:hypothetical protein